VTNIFAPNSSYVDSLAVRKASKKTWEWVWKPNAQNKLDARALPSYVNAGITTPLSKNRCPFFCLLLCVRIKSVSISK